MHSKHKIIKGQYVTVHQLNDFFGHVSLMMLEHFDTPEYADVLFSVGTYIEVPFQELQRKFPNKKIIIYQLEQLMGLQTWQPVDRIINNLRGASEIWDYDYLNVHFLETNYGIKTDKIVPLLYTKSLETISNNENPSIDVLFYGFLNERRFKIFQMLQGQLYGRIKIVWVYGSFDLDNHVADSKVILNLHAAEPWNRQEQVRMFYPVINGKTVVSEVSQRNNMPDEIVESEIENLAHNFLDICATDKWKNFGLQAKENFKNRTKEFLQKEFNRNSFNF